jgi:hypothetical protein
MNYFLGVWKEIFLTAANEMVIISFEKQLYCSVKS